MSGTLSTLIAVLGTLLAGLLTTALKDRSDRIGRRIARLHTSQDAAVDAVAALVKALSDHRRAMWDLEALRVRDADPAEIQAALDVTLVTRSAMTEPHVRLLLLFPALADAVNAAVQATYDMDSAVDATRSDETLTARRLRARAAERELIATATDLLQQSGVGLPVPTHKTVRA